MDPKMFQIKHQYLETKAGHTSLDSKLFPMARIVWEKICFLFQDAQEVWASPIFESSPQPADLDKWTGKFITITSTNSSFWFDVPVLSLTAPRTPIFTMKTTQQLYITDIADIAFSRSLPFVGFFHLRARPCGGRAALAIQLQGYSAEGPRGGAWLQPKSFPRHRKRH